MKLKNKLSDLSNVTVDNSFVSNLEKEYASSLPDKVKLIVSINEETVFYEDFPLLRSLSHAEITDASSDMAVDFIGKKILPLFDMGDNDYIVYDITEKVWCMFNIVDDVKFGSCKELIDLL